IRDEERVVVQLSVVPQTEHGHDVEGSVLVAVLINVEKKGGPVAKRDALGERGLGELEPLRVRACKADEGLDAAPVVQTEGVEIERAAHEFAPLATRTKTRAAGAFERVRHEIDTNLRYARAAARVEHPVAVLVEREAIAAVEVGASPRGTQLAVLLPFFSLGFVEWQPFF